MSEVLGRDRSAHGESQMSGYRNIDKRRQLDTAEERLGIEPSQVRDKVELDQSTLWQALSRRTEILEHLVS